MNNKTAVVYVHGKGGSEKEAGHYVPLFQDCDVIGLPCRAQTPWDAMDELRPLMTAIMEEYEHVRVIANSIGAFFAMHAFCDLTVEKAYFISPVVDMERLITDMMQWAGVTEYELFARKTIETAFGETLSCEYLLWVREHRIIWNAPTYILYGGGDHLQSRETIMTFAKKTGAVLTIMEEGEHWFHTSEQMAFLDQWIKEADGNGRKRE